MALKIRLRQQGRTNQIVYRLVVADTRSPRDGKYVEMVGWYNPYESEPEKNFEIKLDRIEHWLKVGARPTEKAEALIGRAAPDVIRQLHESEVAKRVKRARKRKEAKKK